MQARKKGVDLLLVPKQDFDELAQEGWPDEADRLYVGKSVRGVATFVDILALAVEGGLHLRMLGFCALMPHCGVASHSIFKYGLLQVSDARHVSPLMMGLVLAGAWGFSMIMLGTSKSNAAGLNTARGNR